MLWIARYRRKILVKGIKDYLKITFKEAIKHYPDWEFKEIGIADDHVHIHMVIPPKYSVSYVVETLKKNTSRRMREKFTFLKRMYRGDKGVWSVGYFVSTVGITEEVIKRYVARQGKEDTGQAELEL
ncbi:MAG: IS200/IS605 family transposase [Candidatus Omnitrophota bacterium]